jgi:hypothetical protein
MWKSTEGSTARLIQLCLGYFTFYTITGVAVKYFTGKASLGFLGMGQIGYTTYNTLGGVLTCLAVVFAFGWQRFSSQRLIARAGITFPSEYLYIIPSGVCTAVVIVTTTLIYTIFPTVMVAMVVMRASIIVISRLVDGIQIAQGILKKRVYAEENIAVLIAIAVVITQATFSQNGGGGSVFDSPFGVGVMASYIVAYTIRIYIMNYYKNTRPPGAKLNNQGFFAIEQIAASVAMAVGALLLLAGRSEMREVLEFRSVVVFPPPFWIWAAVVGIAYGCVAFFSVFIFMFKGRTATFAGLVNRLTSLVAGTVSTLILWLLFGGNQPRNEEWITLGLIFLAVGFLSVAERKRAAELAAAKEV